MTNLFWFYFRLIAALCLAVSMCCWTLNFLSLPTFEPYNIDTIQYLSVTCKYWTTRITKFWHITFQAKRQWLIFFWHRYLKKKNKTKKIWKNTKLLHNEKIVCSARNDKTNRYNNTWQSLITIHCPTGVNVFSFFVDWVFRFQYQKTARTYRSNIARTILYVCTFHFDPR